MYAQNCIFCLYHQQLYFEVKTMTAVHQVFVLALSFVSSLKWKNVEC